MSVARDISRARLLRRPLGALLLLVSLLASPGCTHPCDELEVKLCDVLAEEKRCALIQDEERRALLTRDTCQSVLDKLNRR